MSFLGGAECSTAGNPLTQFTKHVQDDNSLQRDRLVGRGPGGIQEGMRSQQFMGGSDKMMDEFMQQSGHIPPGPAQPFAMEQMRRELENIHANAPPRTGSPGWAAEFNPAEQARMENAFQGPQIQGNGFSPSEFAQFQQNGRHEVDRTASPATSTLGTMSGYQRPMGMGYGMGMGGYGMMSQSMYMQRPMNNMTQQDVKGKGKERMIELDDENWEAQFAQIDAAGQKNLDEEANAAMEAELNELDRSVPSGKDDFGDFESVWKGIQAEIAAEKRQMAGDQQQFSNVDLDNMHMGELDQWEGFENLPTHANVRDPMLGDYMFEDENMFKNVDNPFEEGMHIMNTNGNLSLAALAFEAAVQKDSQHVEAWTMLGTAQAQNEKESPAIRALEQALRLDPSNAEALMNLAVSYTNEGYDTAAYRTLERWLSTKYPQLLSPNNLTPESDIGFTDRHNFHSKVTDLFIKAAQLSPTGEQMDPDVQVGLGVLFYGDEEYTKAVDCFNAALASTEQGISTNRQQLPLLWNRLGATLANSGRSEEAIAAYEHALTLNPNFVRARYNLGVSCINIGCYPEAAQHLLGALAMHEVVAREGIEKVKGVVGDGVGEEQLEKMVGQNQSTNLFDTLRRVFGHMGRRDLADKVGMGMDVESFRGEFEF
ncbi:MAG: Peroxisomal membrane signal receptor PTS1 [Cirrosporium novae-zelandiae]|nr:MAG: Peroxisomal membrane signal receptor PTS1 [Cirrosporium novae-zelandiae]